MSKDYQTRRKILLGNPFLFKDQKGTPIKKDCSHRAAVGMLNYLQGSTRPDTSMAVHQCTRLCNDPKLSHERALQIIVSYLIQTNSNGLRCQSDKSKGIESCADADFSEGCDVQDSCNVDNLLSRTGYVICCVGIPTHCKIKLQS